MGIMGIGKIGEMTHLYTILPLYPYTFYPCYIKNLTLIQIDTNIIIY